MSEELISKKELLEEMNISYGQLYRWKRKKLIPEEWFIKKSVSSGQETFFPREKVIERITLILNSKDDISLDELADKLTYNIKNIKLNKNDIIKKNIVSISIINKLEEIIDLDENYNERSLFTLIIYNKLLNTGVLNLHEANEIILSIYKNYEKINKEKYTLIVKRKLGVCFYYILFAENDISIDSDAIEIVNIPFKDVLEKISSLK